MTRQRQMREVYSPRRRDRVALYLLLVLFSVASASAWHVIIYSDGWTYSIATLAFGVTIAFIGRFIEGYAQLRYSLGRIEGYARGVTIAHDLAHTDKDAATVREWTTSELATIAEFNARGEEDG